MDWLTNNPALMWLVIAVVFLVIEAMTVALLTIWFVGGALVAMVLALLHAGTFVQMVGFIVASIGLLLLARPLIRRRNLTTIKTNADSLVGKIGIVTKESTEFHAGQGRVGGQIWTIMHEEKKPMLVDSKFVVKSIDGVKLIVADM